MTSWPPPADELASSPLLRATGPDLEAIGGGHGLSIVLAAARSYAQRVTGVVTVADDGGSSGRLTTALDIPPPGDMRRGLLALSPDDTVWRRLFEYRFTDTDVAGHSMGNLILAALTELMGDFEEALLASGYLLGARGRIVPVACQSLQLSARIDHEIVSGQVAVAQHRARFRSSFSSLTSPPIRWSSRRSPWRTRSSLVPGRCSHRCCRACRSTESPKRSTPLGQSWCTS